MDHVWIEQRPHLASLVHSFEAILKLADELYQQGRATGESVDYGQFEERVARATASVEQCVHQIALSGLDVDAPFHPRVGQALSTRSSHRSDIRFDQWPRHGEAHAVPRARPASGSCARPHRGACRRGGRQLAATGRSSRGSSHVASHLARSGSNRPRVDATAVLSQQHRASRACGRRGISAPSRGSRAEADRNL